MKATEITKTGFYWRWHRGEWSISHVDDWLGPDHPLVFTLIGNERTFDADQLAGDFIGPIESPPTP